MTIVSRLFRSSSSLIHSFSRKARGNPSHFYSTVHKRAAKPWSFLKIGAFTAFPATVAAISYAFTIQEVDKKLSALRSMSNYSVEDGASDIEKFKASVYSSTIKMPLKIAELYIHLRKTVDRHRVASSEPLPEKLLPDVEVEMKHVLTLVLDLEETLVKTDWKSEGPVTYARPGANEFLEEIGQYYEIIVYSDEPEWHTVSIVNRLDEVGNVHYKLGRKATINVNGKSTRDLSKLNRDLGKIIYISGNALGSCLQPENTLSIKPWRRKPDESDDVELLKLIPFLEIVALVKPDVRDTLALYQGPDLADEFKERMIEYERRMIPQDRWFTIFKRFTRSDE